MTVRHIYISPAHNYFGHHGQPPGEAPVIEVETAELVAGHGIVGDRFYDFKADYKGQITFFSQQVHEAVSQQLGTTKPPSVYRRNVIVAECDLAELIGKKFQLQGMEFEGVAECSPCHWMDQAVGPGAEAALKGQGGLRAKILTSGTLRRDS